MSVCVCLSCVVLCGNVACGSDSVVCVMIDFVCIVMMIRVRIRVSMSCVWCVCVCVSDR